MRNGAKILQQGFYTKVSKRKGGSGWQPARLLLSIRLRLLLLLLAGHCLSSNFLTKPPFLPVKDRQYTKCEFGPILAKQNNRSGANASKTGSFLKRQLEMSHLNKPPFVGSCVLAEGTGRLARRLRVAL